MSSSNPERMQEIADEIRIVALSSSFRGYVAETVGKLLKEAIDEHEAFNPQNHEEFRELVTRCQQSPHGHPLVCIFNAAARCLANTDAREDWAEACSVIADAVQAEARGPDKTRGKADKPDGPALDGDFRWQGKLYKDMKLTAWRLVRHLWGTENNKDTIHGLAEPVWRDHEGAVSPGRIGSARKTANNFFNEHAIPLLVQTKGDSVELVFPPRSNP